MIDGLRLQDYTLSVSDGTFKNSCMQALQQYKQNFIHIANWCSASPCDNDDTLLNGQVIPLQQMQPINITSFTLLKRNWLLVQALLL